MWRVGGCIFCYFLSSVFQICFNFQFLADGIIHQSFISRARPRTHICNLHTTNTWGEHKRSPRTEKKGVRFFLNICSLLYSPRVLSARVGPSFWPETFPFDICWWSQIFWPKNLFINTTLSHPRLTWLWPIKKDSRTLNQLQEGESGRDHRTITNMSTNLCVVFYLVYDACCWVDFFFAHRYQNQFDYTHTQCYLPSTLPF